jgi:hypothetical protein
MQLEAQLEQISTDRPDQTESPSIVPAGFLQNEHGISFITGQTFKSFGLISTLFRYGINENFECRVTVDPFIMKYEGDGDSVHSGIAPISVGIKSKLIEGSRFLPSLSFIAGIQLNRIASEKEKTNYPGIAARFSASNQLLDQWSIGYNFGIEWDGIQTNPAYVYTFTSAFTLNEQLGCFVEVFGAFNNSLSEHQVDGGFTFLANINCQFDISGGYNLNTEQVFGGIGAAYRINCRNKNG